MQELNSFSDILKITCIFQEETINFSDVKINLSYGHLMTNMYIKPSDFHQYLHYSSSHPKHIKNSIVYSQSLRARRLCSHEKDFWKNCNKMKSWFLKQGYPKNIISEKMKNVKAPEKGLRFVKESRSWLHAILSTLNRLGHIIKITLMAIFTGNHGFI